MVNAVPQQHQCYPQRDMTSLNIREWYVEKETRMAFWCGIKCSFTSGNMIIQVQVSEYLTKSAWEKPIMDLQEIRHTAILHARLAGHRLLYIVYVHKGNNELAKSWIRHQRELMEICIATLLASISPIKHIYLFIYPLFNFKSSLKATQLVARRIQNMYVTHTGKSWALHKSLWEAP